jgi:hypothetical protein
MSRLGVLREATEAAPRPMATMPSGSMAPLSAPAMAPSRARPAMPEPELEPEPVAEADAGMAERPSEVGALIRSYRSGATRPSASGEPAMGGASTMPRTRRAVRMELIVAWLVLSLAIVGLYVANLLDPTLLVIAVALDVVLLVVALAMRRTVTS